MDWDNDDVRARDRSVRNVVSPLDWKLDLILPLSFSANVLSFLTKTSRLPPFCIRSVYLRSLFFCFTRYSLSLMYTLFAIPNYPVYLAPSSTHFLLFSGFFSLSTFVTDTVMFSITINILSHFYLWSQLISVTSVLVYRHDSFDHQFQQQARVSKALPQTAPRSHYHVPVASIPPTLLCYSYSENS